MTSASMDAYQSHNACDNHPASGDPSNKLTYYVREPFTSKYVYIVLPRLGSRNHWQQLSEAKAAEAI